MKYILEIVKVFGAVENEIRKSLLGFDVSSFSEVEAGQTRKRLGRLLDGLNVYAAKWARRAVGANYAESQVRARARLEFIGAKRTGGFNQRHVNSIKRFEDEIMKDYIKATSAMRTMIGKYFYAAGRVSDSLRQIQEFDISDYEDAIERIIRKAREGAWKAGEITKLGITTPGPSLSRSEVSKIIQSYLRRKIGDGNFININGRNYNVKDYAELVARTRMREAQTEATKELCKEFDNDLVQFSKHDNPCEECANLEGQVFSISGDNPDYPELTDDETPPIHPRCEHNLNPTSENALSWRNA